MIRKLFTLKWTSGLLCAVLLCVSAVALRAQTDIPDWSKLRAAYDFDSKKAPEVKTERKFSGVGSALHLTYKGPSGSTVTGLFVRPKADGVYPVVLLLHGRGDQKDTMVKYIGEPLVENGLAVLALDAPYHGERKVAGKNPTDALVFAEAVHEGNRDYRAALDWLASRKDVDMKHV